MKSRSMSIYIATGLVGLFIVSLFIEIEPQAIVGLSVATLFFTIAQLLDSQISFWNEDLKNQVDVFNNVGNFNLSPQNLLFVKIASKYQNPPKKQRIMQQIASILFGMAFIVLFLSFVVPINISEKVGTSVTVLSFSLLFFSIWLVDKQEERKAQWSEVQIAAMLIRNSNTQAKIENDIQTQDATEQLGVVKCEIETDKAGGSL